MSCYTIASRGGLIEVNTRSDALEIFALGILRGDTTVYLFAGAADSWQPELGAEWDSCQSADLAPDAAICRISAHLEGGSHIDLLSREKEPFAETFARPTLVAMLACYRVKEIWLYWLTDEPIPETLITVYRIERADG